MGQRLVYLTKKQEKRYLAPIKTIYSLVKEFNAEKISKYKEQQKKIKLNKTKTNKTYEI